jgi:hypothetical protein
MYHSAPRPAACAGRAARGVRAQFRRCFAVVAWRAYRAASARARHVGQGTRVRVYLVVAPRSGVARAPAPRWRRDLARDTLHIGPCHGRGRSLQHARPRAAGHGQGAPRTAFWHFCHCARSVVGLLVPGDIPRGFRRLRARWHPSYQTCSSRRFWAIWMVLWIHFIKYAQS